MKRALFLAVGAAIALQPIATEAQVFNGTPMPVEYLDFVGGSGVGSSYGVQVGPYSAEFEASTLTGRTMTSPQFSVYCVDYLHYARDSDGLVNVSALGGDLSATRLGSYGRYQTSAYLSSLFDGWEAHAAALNADTGMSFSLGDVWGGLHSAVWAVATGPTELGATNARTDAARDYFFALASTNAGSYDTSGWYVLSEADMDLTASNSGQEFLVRAGVPEPSTLLLMLTGMALMFGVSRRRFVENV
jgi:hypothetical protein